MSKRVLLNLKRYRQRPSECAIAAASTLAHYYDKTVTYNQARKLIAPSQRGQGLWTSQQARLLNMLGFGKVSIVTADLSLVDYSWKGLSKQKLVRNLQKLQAYYVKKEAKLSAQWVEDLIVWLDDPMCDNRIIISQNFPYYIRRDLGHKRPVGASFNWTSLHKFSQLKSNGGLGEPEEHCVVIRGYDTSGIFVVDSHYAYYRGKRANMRKGYYKITWEKFLVNAPYGDLVLVG